MGKVIAIVIGVMALAGVVYVYAADISDALYRVEFRFNNTSTATVTNAAEPLPFGISTLIDQDFVEADAFNSAVRHGSTDIAFMPSSNRLVLLGAISSTTSSRTDETTDANDAGADDVALGGLTVTGFYIGMHTPGRILTFNIGQAGIGTWDYVWEYYDSASSTYRALAGVVDNTNDFRVAGTSTVSFNMPANFGTTTEESITAYWVRARQDSLSSQTQAALGTQLYYETSQWWTFVDTMAPNEERPYNLYLGGPTDMVSYHHLFTGTDGITTTHAANLEPGGEQWEIEIRGFIDTAATSDPDRSLALKDGAVKLYVSAVNSITAEIQSGTATSTMTLTGVTPGVHTISLYHDIANDQFVLDLDNGTSTATSTALAVVANASAWEWGTNGSAVYLDYVKFRRIATSTTTIRPGLTAADDTWIRSDFPDLNTDPDDHIYAIQTAGGLVEASLIRFVLSTVPDDAVASIFLDLYAEVVPAGGGTTLQVERVTGNWVDTTVTYNTQPTTTATGAVTALIDTSLTHYLIDITTQASGWFDGTATNYGVMVTSTEDKAAAVRFTGGEDVVQTAQRPALIVYTYDTSTTLRADSANTLWYQLTSTPGLTVFDRSGSSNTGNMTWPAYPDNLTIAVDTLTSVNTAQSLTLGPGAPTVAGGISAPPNVFGGETGASLPFGPVFNAVFTDANIPIALFWTVVTGTIVVLAGILTVGGTQSLGLGVMVMGILILGFTQIGNGLLPLWTLFVYAPVSVAALTMRNKLA